MNDHKQFMAELKPGDEVYWFDPGDPYDGVQEQGSTSGIYRIVEVFDLPDHRDEDTIVVLINDAGSEVEAYMGELS